MNVFVFDIETVPDVDLGRKLNKFNGLSDNEVAQALFVQRRAQTHGNEFLPVYMHKVVCISGVLRCDSRINVWSLGDVDEGEKGILQRFFDGIARFSPTLVSYNGSGFDLPVLHYRALYHGVCSPSYWESGESDTNFRWNNYLNRYHTRHSDIMDILSNYNTRLTAPLESLAVMLGYPGKMGMQGDKVWQAYQQGEIKKIRDYCETDALNTYLVYLRFAMIRGHLSHAEYEHECEFLRSWLVKQELDHFSQFVEQWSQDSNAHKT